jgi:hypothetical protein
MNERIKEIWEEATVSVWPRPGKFTAGEYDYHIENFVELIVRECADIMDGRDENGNAKDGQYLLTQFGIDASQRYT